VASNESCDKAVGSTTAMLKEDGRRPASSDTNQALLVLGPHVAELTIGARAAQEPWRTQALEKRSLSTTLRI
jgi:hypothetical protein